MLGRTSILLLALTVPLSSFAAERFVSTTGNDTTGTGAPDNPYRTIKKAISVGSAGDIITIRGPQGANLYQECDVRLRQRMMLRSPQGERAHINCNINTPDSVVVQIDPGASGSRVSNLELSGSAYYGVMLQTNWYQGGPSTNTGATDVILEDLLIHHTGRDGIKLTPKSNRATIRRVEIHHTGARDNSNADGIDNVNADEMLVEDSYIHHTATTGLYFKGGARDVVIQRNHIENTGDAGILVGFDTSVAYFDLEANPDYYEAIRGIVRNNVIRNTGYSGIGMYASKDSIVANNTIINAGLLGHSAIYFGVTFQDWDPDANRPPTINPRILNNLVIQPNSRCVEIRYSNELGGLSGLTGSPGTNWNGYQNNCTFRDNRPGSGLSGPSTLNQWRAATGTDGNSKEDHYEVSMTGHLPANSPAIDAGVQIAEVVDDMDSEARGGVYDIGADEVPLTTTPPRNRIRDLVPSPRPPAGPPRHRPRPVLPPITPNPPGTPPRTRPRPPIN